MIVREMLRAAVAAIAACSAVWPAPPEVCRIQGGQTRLIFGTGFDRNAAVHAWSPEATEEELMQVLEEAVAAGLERPGAGLPPRPPGDATRLRILETDPRGLVLAAEFHASYNASGNFDANLGPEVCWVEKGITSNVMKSQ